MRPFAPEVFILSREPHLIGQGGFPVSLQGPRDQPVLGLGARIAATRLVDLVLRAFQTVTPLLLQRLALSLQIGRNRQTGLERRWLQRL